MPHTARGSHWNASGRRIFRRKNGKKTFAWPANNMPPYPPLAQRILRVVLIYAAVLVGRSHSAANFYAVPGSDLARQDDRNIIELSV